MLGKCANPDCQSQFRSLRDGKLFHFQAAPSESALPSPHEVEHFWLCESCARDFTLLPVSGGAAVIAPLRRGLASDGGHIGS